MPIVGIIVGAILVDLGLRGTEHLFGKQLVADFGTGHFLAWAAAITGLGALGYNRELRPISTGGLALLLVVMIVINGRNLFPTLAQDVETAPTPTASVALPSTGGSGGGSGIVGTLLGLGATWLAG